MSRQSLQQEQHIACGLCAYCNRPLHPSSKRRCWHHLIKSRAYTRKKQGTKIGYRTGRGRPAITRIPSPEQSDLRAA